MEKVNVPGSYGDGRRRFRAVGRVWWSLGRRCLTALGRKRRRVQVGAELAQRSEKPTEELHHPTIRFPFSFAGNCHFLPACEKLVSGKLRVLTADFFPLISPPHESAPPHHHTRRAPPFQLQHRRLGEGGLLPLSAEDLSLQKPRTPAETYWILRWKRLGVDRRQRGV